MFALPLLLAAVCGPVELPEQPNIVWIMADDLGYGDLGCFGQRQIATPRLDRLAREGMRLTSFYAGCTVCRPSRLALWTGEHTGHTAINSNASYVMRRSDKTLAELLNVAGYVCGGVGKWAMGGPETRGTPHQAGGFDYWMGFLDQGAAHNHFPTHLFRCQGHVSERVELPGNYLLDVPAARGRVSDPRHRKTYAHDVMTKEALDFIRRHQKAPFLLTVHWTIPHANNEGGRVTKDGMEVPNYGSYADKEWPTTEKGFAAMIEIMDRDAGAIVDLLRELELDHKTLVIFTSDNGPHSEGGHSHKYFNSNGPLRGFKRDLYEGGIRVPTIVWWPGVVEAGSESDALHASWDLLPTVAELAGAPAPQSDGISLLPTIQGQPHPQPHASLYWRYGAKQAIRAGPWKAVRTAAKRPLELYNLTSDIGEEHDLAAEHPQQLKRLQALMLTQENRPE